MAGINLKSIGVFFSSHFVLALAAGLVGGAIGLGYGTMSGDPDGAYHALLPAAVCVVMTYVLKAMIRN
jgi:hypothetical protein